MSGPVFEFALGQQLATPRGPMFVATRWFGAHSAAPGARYGMVKDLEDQSEPQVTYREGQLRVFGLGAEAYKFALGQEIETPDGPRVVVTRWISEPREGGKLVFYRVRPCAQVSPLHTWRENELLELNPEAPVFVGIDRAAGPDKTVFQSVRAPEHVEIKPELKLTIASGRLPELGDGERRGLVSKEDIDRHARERALSSKIIALEAEKEKRGAANVELASRLAVLEGDLGEVRRDAGWQIAALEKELAELRKSSKARICDLENRVETLREVNAEQAKVIGENDRQEQAFLREVDGLGEDHAKLAEVNAQLMQQVAALKGEVLEARKLAAGNSDLIEDKALLEAEVAGLSASLRAETLRREGGEILLADARAALKNLEAELKVARTSAANALASVELIDAQKDGVLEAVQAVMREAANG